MFVEIEALENTMVLFVVMVARAFSNGASEREQLIRAFVSIS